MKTNTKRNIGAIMMGMPFGVILGICLAKHGLFSVMIALVLKLALIGFIYCALELLMAD